MADILSWWDNRLKSLHYRGLTVVIALLGCSVGAIICPAANVKDVGAVGNGINDDTKAFVKAFGESNDIYVPTGKYLVTSLKVPAGKYIHGCGDTSIIILSKKSGAMSVGNNCHIANLHFTSQNVYNAKNMSVREESKAILLLRNCENVLIENTQFENCKYTGIRCNHADNVTIVNCMFRKLNWAIDIIFSHRICISGNKIFDMKSHGIQFWGNWKWEKKDVSDIIITDNYVRNGGSGAIWGTGGQRIVISNNVIDGAKDVGADFEWCEDSIIANNTIRRCKNAGIALFFSCNRIAITGNVVLNNCPVSRKDEAKIEAILKRKDLTNKQKQLKLPWYVRSGIWLTPPNREVFKNDTGHKNIIIVGNVIHSANDVPRRDIWVGSEVENVRIEANVLSGNGIFYGGHHKVYPQRLIKLKSQPILINNLSTPDKPKFPRK